MSRVKPVCSFILLSLSSLFLEPHLVQADGRSHTRSAIRQSTESYQSALFRIYPNQPTHPTYSTGDSAFEQQTTFQNLRLSSITQVPRLNLIQELYQKLREARDWTWEEMPNFPRRLPWLYPEDGCFLRAEVMAQKLKEWGYPIPKQIFAFGNLSFSTPYKQVNWWYHVAPSLRFGNQVYIIDPSVDFKSPLLLQDWIVKISGNLEATQLSVCEAGAVNPDDSCTSTESKWNDSDIRAMLQGYLESEWSNMEVILGSSPAGILGDHPPWPLLRPGATFEVSVPPCRRIPES